MVIPSDVVSPLTYLGASLLTVGVLLLSIRTIVTLTPAPLRLATALSAILHLLLIVGVAALGYAFFHVDDPVQYDRVSAWLADQWQAGAAPSIVNELHVRSFGYYYWVAAIYRVFGHEPVLAQLGNLIFALLAALITCRIAVRVGVSHFTARIAAVAVLFYPTLAVWSVMLLKDMMATLLVLISIDALIVGLETEAFWPWIAVSLIGIVLSWLRFYAGLVILVAGLITMLRRPNTPPAALSRTALLSFSICVVFLTGEGPWYLQVLEFPVFRTHVVGGFSGGRSSLESPDIAIAPFGGDQLSPAPSRTTAGVTHSTRLTNPTIRGRAATVVWKIARFFVVPLPWQRGSATLTLAKLDWLVWWPLVALCAIGAVRVFAIPWPRPVPLILPAVSMTVLYAMSIGNTGSLVRYRADLFPLFAVVGALGADAVMSRLPQRTRRPVTPTGDAPSVLRRRVI